MEVIEVLFVIACAAAGTLAFLFGYAMGEHHADVAWGKRVVGLSRDVIDMVRRGDYE